MLWLLKVLIFGHVHKWRENIVIIGVFWPIAKVWLGLLAAAVLLGLMWAVLRWSDQ